MLLSNITHMIISPSCTKEDFRKNNKNQISKIFNGTQNNNTWAKRFYFTKKKKTLAAT